MLDVPVHFVSIPDAAIRYWMRREQRRRYLHARIGVRGLAIVNESATILATPKRDACPETGADIVVGKWFAVRRPMNSSRKYG